MRVAALASLARADIERFFPSCNPTVADEPHSKDRAVSKVSRLLLPFGNGIGSRPTLQLEIAELYRAIRAVRS